MTRGRGTARETPEARKKRAREIIRILNAAYPAATTLTTP